MHLQTDIINNISMFKADPRMIKEQIDNLIEREYMKRDENDRTILIYLPWIKLFCSLNVLINN